MISAIAWLCSSFILIRTHRWQTQAGETSRKGSIATIWSNRWESLLRWIKATARNLFFLTAWMVNKYCKATTFQSKIVQSTKRTHLKFDYTRLNARLQEWVLGLDRLKCVWFLNIAEKAISWQIKRFPSHTIWTHIWRREYRRLSLVVLQITPELSSLSLSS